MTEKMSKLIQLAKTYLRYCKIRPKTTGLITFLCLGALAALIYFFIIHAGIIITAILLLYLYSDKIFPKRNIAGNEDVIVDCVYDALLDLYESLKVRRPKSIYELNPSLLIKGRMTFYVIKTHPNTPIDSEVLDEGLFLLNDKARHFSNTFGCSITITAVKDAGGYLKVVASHGNHIQHRNDASKDVKSTTLYDRDF
jgi:hypothetical protein